MADENKDDDDEESLHLDASAESNDSAEVTIVGDTSAIGPEPKSNENRGVADEKSQNPFGRLDDDDIIKIRHCRAILYRILNITHVISRYLETYYRYDDELAISPDLTTSLKISKYFDWLCILNNNVIRALLDVVLPPSSSFKPAVDNILGNIRAIPVYVAPENLHEDSIQSADWAIVHSSTITYRDDDGGVITPSCPPVNQTILDLPMYRPYCTPGVYTMTMDQFKSSNLYCASAWHNNRFDLTNTVNLTPRSVREDNDGAWLRERAIADQNRAYMHPSSLDLDVPELLSKRSVSLLPAAKRNVDPEGFPFRMEKQLGKIASSSATAFASSTSSSHSSLASSASNPYTPMRSSNTSGGINLNTPAGVNTYNPGGVNTYNPSGVNTSSGINRHPITAGSVNKTGPYSTASMSSVMLTTDLPKLTNLTSEDLTTFLDSCISKSISGESIINQIHDDIKFLIGIKLKSNPMPNYTIHDIKDWQNKIPIVPLLEHMITKAIE